MTDQITAREREVLALIAAGHTNPSIAGLLGISIGTVKKHVTHIMTTLGAKNAAHAIAVAMRTGVLR